MWNPTPEGEKEQKAPPGAGDARAGRGRNTARGIGKQRAVILSDLASAELAQEKVDACCQHLGEALDELSRQWYATAMERIRDVRRALRPWQDEQCVRDLDERLYDWRTAVSVLRS